MKDVFGWAFGVVGVAAVFFAEYAARRRRELAMNHDCVCEVTAVEPVYAPAPAGVWRVTVRFHNGGTATFAHEGVEPPGVGQRWLFCEPKLLLPEGVCDGPESVPGAVPCRRPGEAVPGAGG